MLFFFILQMCFLWNHIELFQRMMSLQNYILMEIESCWWLHCYLMRERDDDRTQDLRITHSFLWCVIFVERISFDNIMWIPFIWIDVLKNMNSGPPPHKKYISLMYLISYAIADWSCPLNRRLIFSRDGETRQFSYLILFWDFFGSAIVSNKKNAVESDVQSISQTLRRTVTSQDHQSEQDLESVRQDTLRTNWSFETCPPVYHVDLCWFFFFEVMHDFQKQHSPIDRTWIDSWGLGLISIIWKMIQVLRKCWEGRFPMRSINTTAIYFTYVLGLLFCVFVSHFIQKIFFTLSWSVLVMKVSSDYLRFNDVSFSFMRWIFYFFFFDWYDFQTTSSSMFVIFHQWYVCRTFPVHFASCERTISNQIFSVLSWL